MIEKVIKRRTIDESSVKDDLAYWLSRSPDERIEAVEYLRKQRDGNTTRLQRVARVIQRKRG